MCAAKLEKELNSRFTLLPKNPDPKAEAIPLKEQSSKTRILIVDDHELFATGVRFLIEREPDLTVVAQATNSALALAAARMRPDIILLDLMLNGENGVDFLPELLKAGEKARIIIVTGISDPDLHLRAVRLGAKGVVSKSESAQFLIKAIRKVHAGEVWLNSSFVATVITELSNPRESRKANPEEEKIASLTERELEVIAGVAEGKRNKQIAERLFISEKTVRHYMTSIFAKLDVTDRLALMIYAYQHGLAKISQLRPAAASSTSARP
jgi:two-component system nitrate/nitrite response regulator NarL